MANQHFIEEYKTPRQRAIRVEREINLAKWPQLFATHRASGKSRRIKRKDSEVIIGLQYDNKGNEIEVGFLIVPDYITLLGLIYIWELNNKPAYKAIPVHVRSFVRQVLKRTPSRKTYENLERSLKRLKQIPIRWVRAFHDSRTGNLETITDEEFNFLQYLKLKKVRYRGTKLNFKTFSFRFNDHFLQNLLNQETRPIVLTEVVNFKREITVLAYAFLDLIMAKKTHWERRAMPFLREDLQITAVRYKKPSRARQELEKIAEELNGREISSGKLEVSVRKIRGQNDWKLVVHRQPFGLARSKPQTSKQVELRCTSPEVDQLVEQMARVLGKRERNARFYRLIAEKCPRELIKTALQDTLDEERAGNITSSRAAFFGYWIQVLASKRGIDLGLKSSFAQILKEDSEA